MREEEKGQRGKERGREKKKKVTLSIFAFEVPTCLKIA